MSINLSVGPRLLFSAYGSQRFSLLLSRYQIELTSLYDDVFILGFVTRRIRVGIKVHIGGNGVPGDETRQGTDFSEDADFVDLIRDVR